MVLTSNAATTVLETTGAMAVTSWTALTALVRGRAGRRQALRQIAIVSVDSLPVLVLISLLSGFVMVLESASYVESLGAFSLMGWAFGLVTLSQLGPVLVALMFAARAGARTTAELGAMAVTGQLDALRLLGIDPVGYLAAPRFLAMIVMLPLMTALCDAIAIGAGAVGASVVVGLGPALFLQSIAQGGLMDEFLLGIARTFLFGGAIAAVSCTFGFRVRGGAAGAGRAVNDCVVVSALAVFVIDLIFTIAVL